MITTANTRPDNLIGHMFYQRSFLLYFGLVMIALTAFSMAFYRINRSFLRDYILELNEQQVRSTASILDSIFYRVSYASAAFSTKNTVTEYLLGTPKENVVDLERAIGDLLTFFVQANAEISSANVYSSRRKRVVITESLAVDVSMFRDVAWIEYLQAMESARPAVIFRVSPLFEVPTISVVRRIDFRGDLMGGIVINLEIDDIRELIGSREQRDDDGLYIVKDQEQVILSLADEELGSTDLTFLAEARGTMFATQASGQLFNLDYHLVSGSAMFAEETRKLRRILLGFLGAVFIIGLVLSFMLASIAYRPIRRILGAIQEPDLHAGSLAGKSPDEIRFIETSIVRMIATNREMEQRLAERFRSLKREHYKTLQLQINPHFLYNTLESIYWNSVEAFDTQDPVPRSVSALSLFLRKVLLIDAIAVPLREEIELTKLYLTIIEFRFPGSLRVEWDIRNNANQYLVPKLILQPLIENAFYHGIKPTRKPGLAQINAEKVGDELLIRVSDDGKGWDSGVLRDLQDRVARGDDPSEDHIGILNVFQRMRLLFGDLAVIELLATSPRGASIAIRLPAHLSIEQIG
jgi:two-component system, sensor histidine kinase YesM